MTANTYQCPIPENEAQRLRAVHSYEILDTMPEVDFDALTRVAAHAFNTPVAVVGLMDADRLWFKSRLGLDVPQLDRQIAFCAYAVMRPDELLVVEDLSMDQRFQHNPLVTQQPHLRFYAGAPLVDPNGMALGTIAVTDSKPRTFSEAQCAALKDLSTLVVTVLENRRRAMLLGRMALTDHLTGLGNRAQFERNMHSEMSHASRTAEPFSVLYLDLDGFKDVNDNFGHAAGDEVLREVARRLVQQVRTEDAVTRFGGDEFGVIVHTSPTDSVQALSQRIASAITAPIKLSCGETVVVGVSIGHATYGAELDSGSALLDHADRALYEAKRHRGTR
jgi:diguanylate cyclase (GGDEF)-like protein